MADPPCYPDTGDDTSVKPDRGLATGTPRWVKVFGIIAIVLVLLFVVIQFTGVGGGHGPGRHTPSGKAGGQTPPSSVTFSSVTEVRAPLEGGR
ncbi:MAG: hypothetical protein H0U02_05100 [Rubrobacter sp.]|jgi:hypothetical protein|nr:hypothetical protein [Rubrobacter sp.]MBA3790428.1 hypothetical protein [Rubrobacter sp.]